jgi:acetyl-CoA synthetase
MYGRSVSNPDGFWAEHAKPIDWMKARKKIANWSFAPR